MKKFFLLVIMLFLIISSVSAAEEYHTYKQLTLSQTIANDVTITADKENYFIDEFSITLGLFPDEDHRQTVMEYSINPTAIREDDKVRFLWEDVTEKQLSFDVQATVKTIDNPVKITSKVPYPLENVPPQLLPYVEVTDYIDTNKEIRKLANSLASGEDDLFIIEYKLAQWVNSNIEYNLSTLTSDANKPASWVLENGYGVCDEITNLFIALNRALGVPARFVSGVAYSNTLQTGSGWGSHGWAEVYYPGFGWVPYDVTYEQYAYIDPTHISLHKDVDGAQAAIEYSTLGLHYSFEPGELNLQTQLFAKSGKQQPKTSVTMQILKPVISIGSYNLITATIRNPQDYYLVEQLHLSEVDGMTSDDTWHQQVALRPDERKQVYWVVSSDPNLDEDYKYTFPIVLKTRDGRTISNQFAVRDNWETYKKEYVLLFKDDEQKEETTFVPIDCQTDQHIIQNTYAELRCSAKEVPTSELPLRVCLKEQCSIATTTHQALNFVLDTQDIGFQTAQLDVQTKNQQTTLFNAYRVEDLAKLSIVNASIPVRAHVKDSIDINFSVHKDSFTDPSGVVITITHPVFSQEWEFPTFTEQREFSLSVAGTALIRGDNEFIIKASYKDQTRESHIKTTTLTTTAVAESGKDKADLFITTFTSELYKLMGKEEALIKAGQNQSNKPFIISSIVLGVFFFIIIGIVLRIICAVIKKTRKNKEY